MNTLSGERYGYDHEHDEMDPEENLYPSVRRQARQIVHRERVRKLWQWGLGTIGSLNVFAGGSAVLLASFGQGFVAI